MALPDNNKISILYVDDHNLVRGIVSEYLETSGAFHVTQAETAAEAEHRIKDAAETFDVVLLDYSLPDSVGLQTLEHLRKYSPSSNFAIITGSNDKNVGTVEFAQRALAAGATGFFTKDLPPADLIKAVEAVKLGIQYIPVNLLYTQKKTQPNSLRITEREYEVLCLVASGSPNKQVAHELDLSEPTIKMHVKSLFTKVGATNRTQLTQMAKSAGIL